MILFKNLNIHEKNDFAEESKILNEYRFENNFEPSK